MLRRTSTFALALTVIALGACVASAGIVVTPEFGENISGGPTGGDFGNPDAGLNGTGWSSWQVTVSTDDGDVITAVDVRIEGPIHQRWADNDFEGVPNDPTPIGAAGNPRGDSHLTLAAGALIGSAPAEDNNSNPDFNSPLPADATRGYGVGTFMSGAWGIPGASQTTSTPIAFVVLPPGQQATLIYDISTNNGRFSGTAPIGIPEPATILLVSCGALGLVALRRRQG